MFIRSLLMSAFSHCWSIVLLTVLSESYRTKCLLGESSVDWDPGTQAPTSYAHVIHYTVCLKTGPLQLISHNFTNSQHSLIILAQRDLIQFSIDCNKNWLGASCLVSITTAATWHDLNSGFLGWRRSTYHQPSNKWVAKRPWGCVNADRQHSNTCCNFWYRKTFYYSDRNTVCLKDLTFLFITQQKLEWRSDNDCYGNSLQLVLCCKHNCFLTLWFH